jgi:DUF1009 family protein
MNAPIGIVAGGGALPVVLARRLDQKQAVFVVRLAGFADAALEAYSGTEVNIGEIGGAIRALRTAGCQKLVFAGAVRRPEFGALKLDEVGRRHLPRLGVAAQKGDDALLSCLVEIFKDESFDVLGVQDLCPELLCSAGLIAGERPDQQALTDLAKALRIARLIGAEDIGQGCVVANGLVLAIEAQEGTDGMLQRLSDLPPAVRGTPELRRGVLVKCAKPTQDMRIDLPVIGRHTVENAARGGLLGIGLEAGSCLIVDREAVEELARAHGLFVIGLEHADRTGIA